MQETCRQTCQTQNNARFSQGHGAPGTTAVTVQQAEAPANATPAGDAALASDEDKAKKAAKPTKTAKPRERAERRQQ
jgi:hypothetical protein